MRAGDGWRLIWQSGGNSPAEGIYSRPCIMTVLAPCVNIISQCLWQDRTTCCWSSTGISRRVSCPVMYPCSHLTASPSLGVILRMLSTGDPGDAYRERANPECRQRDIRVRCQEIAAIARGDTHSMIPVLSTSPVLIPVGLGLHRCTWSYITDRRFITDTADVSCADSLCFPQWRFLPPASPAGSREQYVCGARLLRWLTPSVLHVHCSMQQSHSCMDLITPLELNLTHHNPPVIKTHT